MTINTQQLAALLKHADEILMCAEWHQLMSKARKDMDRARTTLAKAVRLLNENEQTEQAWLDVQAERRRQVEAEGWSPEHDDEHGGGQMARAGACYALAGSSAPNDEKAAMLVSLAWPWAPQWWKPTTARRDLVKAAALILAEIDRLDRATARQTDGCRKALLGWKCTRTAGHDGPCAAVQMQEGE
ncbi:hypothetical protein [Pseudomonas knackmussii]|uniref:hypothetical protein n=1 Tax=Pseudomonas knackmussii TaxID=65741 RepID=UPI001F42C7D2|nr:hypothetical protein [Pseudomonas knackmussii]